MMAIYRMLVVLLALGLMGSQNGMASQVGVVLEAAVGTLNWDKDKPVGTAVIVVSRPIPDSPYGPIGSGVTLRGPRAWNEGKPVWLSARFAQIVDLAGYRVWWYFWPDRPPVVGDYIVEGTLAGQKIARTIKLTEPTPLPPAASIRVGRITQTEVDASWSSVSGALSYGAAIISSQTTFVPRDASWLPTNITYTTETSGTIRRTSYGMLAVNRVEVYAFNVDLTKVPPQLTTQFNVSWALSAPFDFPPGSPFVPPYSAPAPSDRLPPPPPSP